MRLLIVLVCLNAFSCEKVVKVVKDGALPDSLKFGYQGNRTNYTPDGRIQEYSFHQNAMHYVLYRGVNGGTAVVNITLDSLKVVTIKEKLRIKTVEENYASTSNMDYSIDGELQEFSFQQCGMHYIVYRSTYYGGLSVVNVSLDNLEVMLLSLRKND